MNLREVSTDLSPTVRQPEVTGAAPAVKLSMAGTLPVTCRPRKATTPGKELGSMKPTRSSPANTRPRARPKT